jgi:hypothetical protein
VLLRDIPETRRPCGALLVVFTLRPQGLRSREKSNADHTLVMQIANGEEAVQRHIMQISQHGEIVALEVIGIELQTQACCRCSEE